MKTLSLGRSLVRLVAGTALAVFTAGSALAAGGGSAGGVGAASAGSGGATGGGGGHGGGVSAGGGGGAHAAAPSGFSGGAHMAAPSGFSGVGAGRSFGSSSASYPRLGGSGLVPTTGTPRFNGSLGGTSALRSPYNNYVGTARQGGVNNVGRLRSPYYNTAAIPRSTYGTGISSPSSASNINPYAIRVAPQVNNAWTDPRSSRAATPAARASRYGYAGAYDQSRSYLRDNVSPGQHLYPGASGYLPTNGALNRSGNYGHRFDRSVYNRYRNNYYNTGLLYPYLYGAFFPGYFGYFGNDYLGGYSGDANLAAEDSFNDAAANAPVANNNPGYWEQQQQQQQQPQPQGNGSVDKDTTPPTDDAPLPPNQPGHVGPTAPGTDAARSTLSNNDPDSLVEAVQGELANRGYYAGKVDSIYGDSTREALRRFQTDQRLNVTGRINEATLHALHLD